MVRQVNTYGVVLVKLFRPISGDNNLYMRLLNDITHERRLKDCMARWIRKNELLSEACQELIFEYDQNEVLLRSYIPDFNIG